MADQLFTDGDVITTSTNLELECVAVSSQEVNGLQRFNYVFGLKSEVDADRKAQEEENAQFNVAEPESAPEEGEQ